MQLSNDGLNMSYGIMRSALWSDDENVSLRAIRLIDNIYKKVGIMDFNWLKQEGF